MASGLRLAFGSKARSGKDTCAEYLQAKHGGIIIKYADTIYELMYMIQDHTGLPRKKDSALLQYLGTEWGRAQSPDIWVNVAVFKINKIIAENPNTNIYITDVRFPNEAETAKKMNFRLLQVNRSVENRGNIGRDPNHLSEVSLDDYTGWDYIIENDGSLEDLYKKVDSILNTCYNNKL